MHLPRNGFRTSTWKEKNLDYEIETFADANTWMPFAIETWKEKNLDYEIETGSIGMCWIGDISLEKKRTSITRLKQKSCAMPILLSLLEKKRTSITRLKR